MLSLAVATLALLCRPASAENWPGWRGPRGDGTSRETSVPIHWSTTSNVTWKTELPGSGHASPIAWDDKIFTVSTLAQTQDRVLICLDRKDGKIAWQRTVIQSPLEGKHPLNSHASSTPATDGTLVYVTFLDQQEMVVAAYDLAGHQRWLVRPGVFKSKHGFCSSPLLFKVPERQRRDERGQTRPGVVRVAQNEIGEKCFASPAISNGQIFLRGDKSLYCIGKTPEP